MGFCRLTRRGSLRAGVRTPVRPSRHRSQIGLRGLLAPWDRDVQVALGGRSLRGICSPAGSGPPCSPRGSLPGQGRASAPARFTIQRLQGPTCPISGCHAWRLCLTLPVALAGVGLGIADRSPPRAGSGLPALATRLASGRFPGTGLPWVLSRPAPPRRAASCCDVSRTERRSPGGELLDGLEPENLGTRWVSCLPSGHTGLRAHWAATAASCYDAIAPRASYGGTTKARPRTQSGA